jgi:anti-anti-sigma factor
LSHRDQQPQGVGDDEPLTPVDLLSRVVPTGVAPTVSAPLTLWESCTDVELSVLHRSTHSLIRLRSEIDLATAPGLRERLLGLLQPGMRLVILGLSGVSFCDASGLGMLVGSHRRATTLGVTLRLTALRPQIARLLHIHGLDRILAIYPAPPDTLT